MGWEMKVEHKWDEKRVARARRKKETRGTCFVEKGMKLVSSRISKGGKRFTGCKCADFPSCAEIFRNFPSPNWLQIIYKIFLHNWKLSHSFPLSLSVRLSVSELGKKRLPSKFVRAKVLFSLVFFCHTKILSDNWKVFFPSRFSLFLSHSLCFSFILSFSFPFPFFSLRFIISSMKDDTGTFARAQPRGLKQ